MNQITLPIYVLWITGIALFALGAGLTALIIFIRDSIEFTRWDKWERENEVYKREHRRKKRTQASDQ